MGNKPTSKKEKENIEAGFSSLKLIFLGEVAFYRKCIQTVDHTLLWRHRATWLNWASKDPGTTSKNYAFSQPQCFSFYYASSLPK
jgi:hypothetical protein